MAVTRTAGRTALVSELVERIQTHADERRREAWDRRVKGEFPARGVSASRVRQEVAAWVEDHDLADRDGEELLALATALAHRDFAEEKLAGIVLLQDHAIDRLDPRHALPRLAAWFDNGHVQNWFTCDSLCLRVLGPMIAKSGRPVARRIAGWQHAPGVWRRRAACVSFLDLAPNGDANFPGFTYLVMDVCSATIRDTDRFAQAGTGRVLRELSRSQAPAVIAFIGEHLTAFNRESLRIATSRLADEARELLLGVHLSNGHPTVSTG